MSEILEELNISTKLKLYIELIIPNQLRILFSLIVLNILSWSFIAEIVSSKNFDLVYKYTLNIVTLSQNISLVMFAVLVTGYALFQALLTRNHALHLCNFFEENRSMFTRFNNYFYYLGATYISWILFNFLILAILPEKEIVLILVSKFKLLRNGFLVYMLINLYIFISIILFWDMKSFLKNLYQNFKLNVFIQVTQDDSEN